MEPIIVVIALMSIGPCLMLAAFVMAVRRRGLGADAQRIPRYLILVGASLGTLGGLLMFVPGVVPWWDYSFPWNAWGCGVVFGLVLGYYLHVVVNFPTRAGSNKTEATHDKQACK